jgi:hypothetical protein
MITWTWIVFNALWIFALALGLSQLGLLYWKRESSEGNFDRTLAAQKNGVNLYPAVGLFCLGLFVTSVSVWERVFWVVLAGLCLFQLIRTLVIAWKKR